jgi:hypothetical protein
MRYLLRTGYYTRPKLEEKDMEIENKRGKSSRHHPTFLYPCDSKQSFRWPAEPAPTAPVALPTTRPKSLLASYRLLVA